MSRLPGGVLPDETVLGELPSMRAARSIPDYAAGAGAEGAAIARGTAALGAGLKDLAGGLAYQQHADDAFELSKAKAAFTTGKIGLDSEFERDTDYATAQQRYGERLTKLRDESGATIANSKLRDKFGVLVSDDVARGMAGIQRHTYKLQADSEIASAQSDLTTWSDKGLQSPDPAERDNLVKMGQQRIEGLKVKGYITAQQAQTLGQNWVENYGEKWLATRDPAEQQAVLRKTIPQGDLVDQIIKVESGGNPNDKNSKSSALGLGQFTKATWLDLIKKNRPEIANGRDDETLLALRTDPTLSRDMVKVLADQNTAFLRSRGLPTDPGSVYLAHFLGPQGAAAVLGADPNTPVSELVGKGAVSANPTVLGGKTAGSVIAWAQGKMGGETQSHTPADFIPFAKRVAFLRQADQHVMQEQNATAVNRGAEYDRHFIDAASGNAELGTTRAEIEADPLLNEHTRNRVLQGFDRANGEIVAGNAAMAKFGDPNSTYNPFDKGDREAADIAYTRLGGNETALASVVEKTKILPTSFGVGLRGALASADPKRTEGALQVASNLLARHPQIFTEVAGGKEIEKATVGFRHYVEDLGMTAQQAAQKYVESETPEYKAKVRAIVKGEDVAELIKKQVSTSDIASVFDDSWWPGGPAVGDNPRVRGHMLSDYSEFFRDRFEETGSVSEAKSWAGNQLKRVWGVSRINGSTNGVVTRWAPDRAPAYADLPDPAGMIATQAIAAIKTGTGEDIARDKLVLAPIPGGVTTSAYLSGKAPPYFLSWQDSKGNIQTLSPGKAFVADAEQARAALSEDRRVKLEAAAAREAQMQAHAPHTYIRNLFTSSAPAAAAKPLQRPPGPSAPGQSYPPMPNTPGQD